jgi:hypothetical protein
LRPRLVALGERSVTLRTRRCEERLQRFNIHGQLRCDLAHARH